MIIKREFSFNVNRNSALLTASFFLYIILSTVILNSIGDLSSTPINTTLFGDFFVVGHLGFISSFIYLIFAIKFARKKRLIIPIGNYLKENEIQLFNKKYNTNFNLKKPKNWSLRAIIMIFSTTFVIIPFLIFNSDNLNKLESFTLFGIGFTLMSIVFFSQVKSMLNAGEETMIKIFKAVNSHSKNTNIKIVGNDLSYSSILLSTKMIINGIYKEYNFDILYKLSGTAINIPNGGKVLSSGNLNLNFELKSENKNSFVIRDKDVLWKKIIGKDINDCFKKRFDINGITINDIPESLKKQLLEYKRTVVIKIKNNQLVYSIKNKDLAILPFYSGEGVVFFLEFIKSIADEVEMMEYRLKTYN